LFLEDLQNRTYSEAAEAGAMSPTDACDDEITEAEVQLLKNSKLFSPGPFRGPNQPAELHVYPEDPLSPRHTAPTNRETLMRNVDAGAIVILRKDFSAMVGDLLELKAVSDAELEHYYMFVDTLKNHGGPNPQPGETVEQHGYRQSERLIQIRAKEMRRCRELTYKLQEYLAGAQSYTRDEIRSTRYERYILLHKLLIFMDISHENTISRIQRPREECKKCYHNDPRVQLYCTECYEFMNILL
jgi:hypothetical protein